MKKSSNLSRDIQLPPDTDGCYRSCMENNQEEFNATPEAEMTTPSPTPKKRGSSEKKSVAGLLIIFALVIIAAWGFALKLQQNVAANNNREHADPAALLEVERLRQLFQAQIDDSRAFFLLGSQSLFDRQKAERAELLKGLTEFEAKHNLPRVPMHLGQIREATQKSQDIFDQGMDFREKKTESRIVGQFYQSKTNSLINDTNKALDEISKLHQDEINRSREEAQNAAVGAEKSIPHGMMWLTALMAAIFLTLAYLVIRLVKKQEFQLEQQNRLYAEAQKAVQDRDETLSAISHDLKDSLNVISSTAERMKTTPQSLNMVETGELVSSMITNIEGLIQDIRDKKSLGIEGITLRLDQLSIEKVLDDTRLLMQPLAKEHNVRLQIDTVNPPVLAFYDNDRIVRVLANLINNAIKFSAPGDKVVVKVRSDQKFVNVSVIDSGPGIPESKLEGIFDQFWQARKTADKGAGLGLAIVKTIVEAHGGTVEIQSQVGRGTTVTFSLPRRRPVGASLKKSAITVRQSPTPTWHL